MYKSDFIYIENILNASVYFNVTNNVCESKMYLRGFYTQNTQPDNFI